MGESEGYRAGILLARSLGSFLRPDRGIWNPWNPLAGIPGISADEIAAIPLDVIHWRFAPLRRESNFENSRNLDSGNGESIDPEIWGDSLRLPAAIDAADSKLGQSHCAMMLENSTSLKLSLAFH